MVVTILVVQLLSHVWFFATPWMVNPRILCPWDSQARILEWIAVSFSTGYSAPRGWTYISHIGMWVLYHRGTWEKPVVAVWFSKFNVNRSALHPFLEASLKSHAEICKLTLLLVFSSLWNVDRVVVVEAVTSDHEVTSAIKAMHWKK